MSHTKVQNKSQDNFHQGSLLEPTLFNLQAYTSYYDPQYIVGDIERVSYDPSWYSDQTQVSSSLNKSSSLDSFPIHDAVASGISIKVVTVHPPFAFCIGSSKNYVIKGRKTNYRGKVAIHCASTFPSKKLLSQFSFLSSDFSVSDLPLGKIIGFAELTDCFLIDDALISSQSQSELEGGQWVSGNFAWKLQNFIPISQFVSVRAKGSIWDLKSELQVSSLYSQSSFNSGDFVLNGKLGQVIYSSARSIRVQYSDSVKSYSLDDFPPLLFLPSDLVHYFFNSSSYQKPSFYSYTPSGSLVQYVENKRLKSGAIASYPKVFSDRDPYNVNHWRWAYYYEVKVDTKWKNRTLCVPSYLVEDVKIMINMALSVSSIIDFILKNRRSK